MDAVRCTATIARDITGAVLPGERIRDTSARVNRNGSRLSNERMAQRRKRIPLEQRAGNCGNKEAESIRRLGSRAEGSRAPASQSDNGSSNGREPGAVRCRRAFSAPPGRPRSRRRVSPLPFRLFPLFVCACACAGRAVIPRYSVFFPSPQGNGSMARLLAGVAFDLRPRFLPRSSAKLHSRISGTGCPTRLVGPRRTGDAFFVLGASVRSARVRQT